MKAFVAALVGLVVISGLAWFGLEQFDRSTEAVNQTHTGNVRLE